MYEYVCTVRYVCDFCTEYSALTFKHAGKRRWTKYKVKYGKKLGVARDEMGVAREEVGTVGGAEDEGEEDDVRGSEKDADEEVEDERDVEGKG